jgi:hypothetical protein
VDTSSSSQNSKSSLLLCLPAHSLNAHLAEIPFHRTFNSFVFSFCAPIHPLDAHLAELSESSMILFLLNSQHISSSVHSLHLLNAHLAELHRILSDSVFFFKLSVEFFQLHLVPVLNSHLAEPYITPKRFCLQLCLLPHSLSS